MNINLGCGDSHISGCLNIDINPAFNPDVICDFTKPLPLREDSVDKCYLFHVIEHLCEEMHPKILRQIYDVLRVGGIFYISFPEFIRCADNFATNKGGQRTFWKRTIFGRQSTPFDFHVALMYTPHFVELLKAIGFINVQPQSEPEEDWNTIIKCTKGATIPMGIEEIYRKCWFPNRNGIH